MAVTITIDKVEMNKMMKQFQKLPDSVRRTHLLRAERSAANPLRKKIKTAIGTDHKGPTGNLEKSIGNKTGKSKENPQIFVGARIGKGYKGHHAHWIELGTADRIQKSTGRRVGRIKADPIVKRSYEATHELVAKNLQKEVSIQLGKAIKKHFG